MMTSTTSGKQLGRNSKIRHCGIRILAAGFWIFVWQLASMQLKQEILLASPVSVLKRLSELVFTLDFWQSIGFSFGRIVFGFLLGLLLGGLLAVLAYNFWLARVLLEPLITVIKSTPVASFIILCLIWIPSRNLSVFISFLMVLPVVYTNLSTGIRETDKKLLEMAEVFGVGIGKRVRYIYVSQILPYFLTACRLSLGLCWKAGAAAEVIGIPSGSIGEKLYHAKVYLNTPDLFAWTIVIICISFLFERLFVSVVQKIMQAVERW